MRGAKQRGAIDVTAVTTAVAEASVALLAVVGALLAFVTSTWGMGIVGRFVAGLNGEAWDAPDLSPSERFSVNESARAYTEGDAGYEGDPYQYAEDGDDWAGLRGRDGWE